MTITSLENEKVKNYFKLKERKYRDNTNTYIIEGEHLVLEAYKKNLIIDLILEENTSFSLDVNTIYVTKEIIKKISTLDTPCSIMALCKKKEQKDLGNKILLLDKIQDPGNLGTIIRSACAFDIDTIVLGKGTVDLYNPKTIRSTQGMLFHVNIIENDLVDIISILKASKIPIYGTAVSNGHDVASIENKGAYALIMGNEGSGVSSDLLDLCDKYLYIKTNSNVESLNVSIATSILLYEFNRGKE